MQYNRWIVLVKINLDENKYYYSLSILIPLIANCIILLTEVYPKYKLWSLNNKAYKSSEKSGLFACLLYVSSLEKNSIDM